MPVPATLSFRKYAAARGVTHQAIVQAVASGRLPLVNGKLDVAVADSSWLYRREQHHEARQRGSEAEQRRERALLQSTLAKLQTTRHRAKQLRERLVERDKEARAIGALLDHLYTALPKLVEDAAATDKALLADAVAQITSDLGDLYSEALKVTNA